MPIISRASLVCSMLFATSPVSAAKHHLRELSNNHDPDKAERRRHFDANDIKTFPNQQQVPTTNTADEAAAALFKSIIQEHPQDTYEELNEAQMVHNQLQSEQEFFDALWAKRTGGGAGFNAFMSMEYPSSSPSDSPSSVPTVSSMPSTNPSDSPSAVPTAAPPGAPTRAPSVTDLPTATPSDAPSAVPTISPAPTSSLPRVTAFPTLTPTIAPTILTPLDLTDAPTVAPTAFPTASPTFAPTASPSSSPTASPSFARCGLSETDRQAGILEQLDAVSADTDLIRDLTQPQGLATDWILNQDEFGICPDLDPKKIIQRWVLAIIYFSTNGNDWFQCSANVTATDDCGAEEPFVGEERFLSAVGECDWAGISCLDNCVTEIEFEENNLVGTIPTEIGLLDELAIWGMERGGLTSTIPTEIGQLSNLIFLDLDFNQLTGSLTTQLLSLSSLTQLDLNNNQMTGSINDIGVFPAMEFLQLHDNFFTGTVPENVGTFTNLGVFTLHETAISGVMPASVCDLRLGAGNGGVLDSLIADCSLPSPDIICDCCTDCRNT